MTEDHWIYGVHPVMEALQARPESLVKIWIAREDDRRLGRLLKLARQCDVPVQRMPRRVLAKRVPQGANHQGVAAWTAGLPYVDLEQLTEEAAASGGLLLLVDGVQDVGNLGAVLRTAAGAGVDGVILAADATAGLSSDVLRASAGAAAQLKIARTAKPSRWVRNLGENGFQTLLLDAQGEQKWDQVPVSGPLLLVAGGERSGARRGVQEACRQKVAIPLESGVESLNVAVATGVLLFEARRRRGAP